MSIDLIISEILRQTIWGVAPNAADAITTAAADLDESEWFRLHALAVRQGVVALLFDGLMSAGVTIPHHVKMRFISSTDHIEKEYAKKRRIARKLAEVYAGEGIRMMILKGIGISMLYPVAHHRPSSDIDIYLCGDQRRGDELLHKLYGISIDKGRHHHTVFRIKNILIENHYDFIEAHSRASSQRAEQRLKELVANEQPLEADIDGVTYLTPSPTMNALFLTLHSAAHFAAENISIRHLCDWAFFLNAYSKQVDWQEIMHLSDELGFRPFLDVMNGACVRYLGMDASLAPSLSDDERTIERMWADSMEYKVRDIPKNFLRGWIYRIKRRYANRWKQRLAYCDNGFSAFIRSAAIHILPPKVVRKLQE